MLSWSTVQQLQTKSVHSQDTPNSPSLLLFCLGSGRYWKLGSCVSLSHTDDNVLSSPHCVCLFFLTWIGCASACSAHAWHSMYDLDAGWLWPPANVHLGLTQRNGWRSKMCASNAPLGTQLRLIMRTVLTIYWNTPPETLRTHSVWPLDFYLQLIIPPHLSQRWSHFVCQCPGHNHDISLSGTGSEHYAEAVHVVAGRCHVHHLHRTAG